MAYKQQYLSLGAWMDYNNGDTGEFDGSFPIDISSVQIIYCRQYIGCYQSIADRISNRSSRFASLSTIATRISVLHR